MDSMEKPKVINLQTGQPYDVYIGRAGKGQDGYFGNPVREGTRKQKLDGFKEYALNRVLEDEEFRERVKSLEGKTLGCFCKPLPCHGDILAELCVILNQEDEFFEHEKEK